VLKISCCITAGLIFPSVPVDVVLCRVPTGQRKLEEVSEFLWSGKNIFEKSEKMTLDHVDCRYL